MITAEHIARLVRQEDYFRLIDRVLANGRLGGREVRRILTRPPSLRVAGLGLALQRLCEISYGPGRDAEAIAETLMQRQEKDGSFAAAGVTGTAIAVRALLDWQALRRSAGLPEDLLLQTAITRGLGALKASLLEARPPARRPGEPACPHADGAPPSSGPSANPPTLDHREIEIVLWQLGSHRRFRAAIPPAPLAARVSAADPGRDPLARLALAAAA